MPEVITKHPDVVKKVLESAGAKCGSATPKILTKCPREQFCALPGGEICVYPVSGIPEMTQLSRAELCAARTEALPVEGREGARHVEASVAALLPGLVAAALVLRRGRARSRR